MFKKILAGTAAMVGIVGLGFSGTSFADTVTSNTGRTSNSFVAEPGADCMRNGGSSSMTVSPPSSIEGYPGHSSQYVGWRAVTYRWNGSSWALHQYGAVKTAIARPRSATAIPGAQTFTALRSGYYMAMVQVFWYNPTTGAVDGQKMHRVDQVKLRSVSPIGAMQNNGTGSYCTI